MNEEKRQEGLDAEPILLSGTSLSGFEFRPFWQLTLRLSHFQLSFCFFVSLWLALDVMSIEYRDLTLEDIPAGLRLCRIAGWNQLAQDWELFLRLSPGGCRAAVRQGNVVGTVTTVNYENRFAWVGMVLVDPDARGQGVGTRLLQEAMSLLKGIPSIRLDATPQGRPVYQRLGFENEYELCRMQLAETGDRVPVTPDLTAASSLDGSEELGLRPMLVEDLVAVGAIDRQVFGADRLEILRWALEKAPEYAWVAAGRSGIEGYCFGRHGFNFDQIGPVHSKNEFMAQRLVVACLAAVKPGTSVILDPMLHSPGWLGWLQQTGFVHQRPFMRMARGMNRHPGFPAEMWTILGPEFG